MKISQSSKPEFSKSPPPGNRNKLRGFGGWFSWGATLPGCAALAGILLFAACDTDPGISTREKPPSEAVAALSTASILYANPDQLNLTFTEAVDVEDGDVSGFTLEGSVNASSATSLLSGSGTKTLVLQLDGFASASDTITLSYNFITGEEKLNTTSSGKRVESFLNHPVTNGAPDTIPPELISADILEGALTELVLVFSKPLEEPNPAFSGSGLGFGLGSDNSTPAFDAAAAFSLTGDDSTLTLTLAAPAGEGDRIWLNYSGGEVKDRTGNILGPIADFSVTNGAPDWYLVTFDWNGVPVADGYQGTARPEHKSVSIGSPISLPRAADYGTVKTGYTHTGWRDDQGTTTEVPSGVEPIPYSPSGNVTLTAVWTADIYTITYDLGTNRDAANHADNPETYTFADTVDLYDPSGSDAAVFLGWYDNSEFNGQPAASIPAGSTGNKYRYAKWGNPSAELSGAPVTVNARIANALAEAVEADITLTINLTDAKAAEAGISGSAGSWFSATVAGISYTASAQPGAAGITITVSGTPTAVSSETGVIITIPAGKLVLPNGASIGDLAVTGTVKYNVIQTAAAGTVFSVGTPATEVIQVTGAPATIIGSGDAYSGVFIPDRTVLLSPYRMAKYETTWELWDTVVKNKGMRGYVFTSDSGYQGHQTREDGASSSTWTGTSIEGEGFWTAGQKKQRAVTMVSWYDVIAWCNLYSELSGLEPVYYTSPDSGVVIKNANTESDFTYAYMDRSKNGFRLPTEAEWEFAARGGDPNAAAWNYTYAGSDTIDNVAWYYDTAYYLGDANVNYGVHPVGTKPIWSATNNWANTLGLYDMSGNVWEWCWDWYDYSPTANDGSDSPVLDPLGGAALGAYYRVIRGIGWDTHYNFDARVLYRWYTYSNNYGKNTNVGFRLVCPAE